MPSERTRSEAQQRAQRLVQLLETGRRELAIRDAELASLRARATSLERDAAVDRAARERLESREAALIRRVSELESDRSMCEGLLEGMVPPVESSGAGDSAGPLASRLSHLICRLSEQASRLEVLETAQASFAASQQLGGRNSTLGFDDRHLRLRLKHLQAEVDRYAGLIKEQSFLFLRQTGRLRLRNRQLLEVVTQLDPSGDSLDQLDIELRRSVCGASPEVSSDEEAALESAIWSPPQACARL